MVAGQEGSESGRALLGVREAPDSGLSPLRVREGPKARGLALGGPGDGAGIQTLPWGAGVGELGPGTRQLLSGVSENAASDVLRPAAPLSGRDVISPALALPRCAVGGEGEGRRGLGHE